MSLNAPPRVTVAIPLYRSLQFIDVIHANLRNLTYPNLEILISDRHQIDDTIDQLQETWEGDPRIRFLRERDGIGWVSHHNALLKVAEGEYFAWMPHDDSYPEGYVDKLVEALTSYPEAVLAFGWARIIKLDGSLRSEWKVEAEEFPAPKDWTPYAALKFLDSSIPGLAYRGLYRKQMLLDHDLLIRRTKGNVKADQFWVFATGLVGAWVYVPDCYCVKRSYAESTHRQWRDSPHRRRRAARVLRGYVRDLVPSPGFQIISGAVIFLWMSWWVLKLSGERMGTWGAPLIAMSKLGRKAYSVVIRLLPSQSTKAIPKR